MLGLVLWPGEFANARTTCALWASFLRCSGLGFTLALVAPDLNALHEMLVEADIESLEHVPSRLNPADGTTKPDHDLRIPVLRLLSGKDILWRHDPMVTGLFRPRPSC